MRFLTKFFLFTLLALLPALTHAEPISYQAEPGILFTADLPAKLKLPGPFVLLSGPGWLTLNSNGLLQGFPSDGNLGENEFILEVKSAKDWLSFKVVVNVRYRKFTLKVFSAPWCVSCADIVPRVDTKVRDLLHSQLHRLNVEHVVVTGESPYDQPDEAAAKLHAKNLGLTFPARADAWQWKEYRAVYPTGFELPAIALFDETGKIVGTASRGGSLKADSVPVWVNHLLSRPLSGLPRALNVLWVIDNSGSMSVHQKKIAATLPKFTSHLSSLGISAKFGLISTDVIDKPYAGFAASSPIYSDSVQGMKHFGEAILRMGISGSSVEQLFAPVLQNLSADFLTPGADLAIVVVTDEDEQGTLAPADYLSKLKAVADPVRVTHYGMLAAADMAECDKQANTGSWNDSKNSRHRAVISATKGKAFSLCSSAIEKSMVGLAEAIKERLFTP